MRGGHSMVFLHEQACKNEFRLNPPPSMSRACRNRSC